MVKNNIDDLIQRSGIKLVDLARKTGIDVGHLSRMRRGERGISVEQAEKIAEALATTPANVLGLDTKTQSPPTGFSDDYSPYEVKPGDPFAALAGPNRYIIKIDTDCVSSAGPRAGDIAIVDDSAQAMRGLKALDIVVCSYHGEDDPAKATRIIRQFVPPSLLINNSRLVRAPSLDTDVDDVQMLGIIVSFHRALSG